MSDVLKVGDKIRILRDYAQCAPVLTGMECTVVTVTAHHFRYIAPDGNSWEAEFVYEGVTWERVAKEAPKSSPKPELQFMIDIETTGIDPEKEDLLQVGILALRFKDGFWHPGATLRIDQGSSRTPASEFAKKHMAPLYEICNRLDVLPAGEIRRTMSRFFKGQGATSVEDTFLMGWNASNFDIPFLINKGCLVPSTYEIQADGKDKQVGDIHYRVYEIGGAISLACDVLGWADRKKLTDAAFAAYPELAVPPGQEHDALYDCYKQTRILNGLIRMVQGARQHSILIPAGGEL